MSLKAQILKKMTVGDIDLLPGDVVVCDGWKNLKSLQSSRYITLIQDSNESEIIEKKVPVAPKKVKKTK